MTITYTLADAPAVVTVDVQTNVTGDVWASIGGKAVWNAAGDVWKKIETGSRKIMAKNVKWTMGSTALETQRTVAREATHQVTLTNNYYIGVYPVTQAQWSLVQPNHATSSRFNNVTDRTMRPVEQVSYNSIRDSAAATSVSASFALPGCGKHIRRSKNLPKTGESVGRLRRSYLAANQLTGYVIL